MVYFPGKVSINLLGSLINEMGTEPIVTEQFTKLSVILQRFSDIEEIKKIIKELWTQYITLLIESSSTSEELKKTIDLFKTYDMSFAEFMNSEDYKELVKNELNYIFNRISDEEGFSSDSNDILESYWDGEKDHAKNILTDKLWDIYTGVISDCGLSDYDDYLIDDVDLNEKEILRNLVDNLDHRITKEGILNLRKEVLQMLINK